MVCSLQKGPSGQAPEPGAAVLGTLPRSASSAKVVLLAQCAGVVCLFRRRAFSVSMHCGRGRFDLMIRGLEVMLGGGSRIKLSMGVMASKLWFMVSTL